MIIGNGMIAKAMRKIDRDDLLIFASGVSNSLENNIKSYIREYKLLQETIIKYPSKKIIYFSTCSIYDSSKKNDTYVNFKVKIERFIKINAQNYIIFRIGNIISEGGNPNTLINFLTRSIVNNIKFTLFTGTKRLIIDIDDVIRFVQMYESKFNNKIVDLYYPYQYSILEIVKKIEDLYNIKGKYDYKEIGSKYELEENGILEDFFFTYPPPMIYLGKVLNKWFGNEEIKRL